MNRRLLYRIFLLFPIAFPTLPPLHAQATARTPANFVAPGPKPQDAPVDWKGLVGIYRHDTDTILIFERSQHLYWGVYEGEAANQRFKGEFAVGATEDGQFRIFEHIGAGEPSYSGGQPLSFRMDPQGGATSVTLNKSVYARIDAGSDPARFFHVKPLKPIDQLRAEALAGKPPVETLTRRHADLVELITLDSSIHLDIRYAQSNNFLSTRVYTQARAFLQRPAALALVRALRQLEPFGYGLLIHDAYRPWYVTKMFWDATPPEDHQFVANPNEGSRHNRGCAVDLTLYELATGKPVEMPGLYDEMSPRSYPNFPGGTSLQRWHRDLLRRAMESEGFTVNESEWWHFDFKDWKLYRLMNAAFEDLGRPAPPGPANLH